MNSKYYILFIAKAHKPNSKGQIPIYLRLTILCQRYEIATQCHIEPSKWNPESGLVRGFSEEARTINAKIGTTKKRIEKLLNEIIDSQEDLTMESFKRKLKPMKNNHRFLIEIFQDHNNKLKAQIGESFAKATYGKYETTLKHLKSFIMLKFEIADIDIALVDLSLINDFEFFLRTQRKCENNSAVKYVKNLSKIISICYSYGWITKNPFLNYKSKRKIVDREFLSEDELITIWNKDLRNERLNIVKDIFLFSCYTGLAYIDVKELEKSNIVTGIDREKWIHTSRHKTEVKSHIPLLPIPIEIIKKYQNHPQVEMTGRVLPVLSNQKMNAYLKEVADICGINKNLTFHMARHTFATTVTLSNGVPIETVSKMLGHTSLKTTQHYAKILDTKISHDMSKLKEKYSVNQEKIIEVVSK